MSDEKTLAGQYFDAYIKCGSLRDGLSEALLIACDVKYNPPEETWPFEDITYDYYDASFEFKDVQLGWCPTKEQLEKCWVLGFDRCWVCYVDGTEKQFVKKVNEQETPFNTR